MQHLLNFLIKKFIFLTFLLLFLLAIALTIQSHSYHNSQLINSSNYITGFFYSISNSITNYFDLKEDNKVLSVENALLREKLFNLKSSYSNLSTDSIAIETYRVTKATVIKNSYNKPINHLLLNKGSDDSVMKYFGVISSKGIVGIIENTSKGYSKVLSILSKNSKINAKLKHHNYFGTILWSHKSPQYVKLVDVSNFAPLKIGDTIITGGQSTIFPKDIDIGTIESYIIDIDSDSYIIKVKLFNDMTNLETVYIIENRDRLEIKKLQDRNYE